MAEAVRAIAPIILSGGSGTRLWPLSRESFPKQLLPLVGEQSLLQQTSLRTRGHAQFRAPIVVCSAEHRFTIGEQLRAVGVSDATIILEPVPRNTAPAAAVGALRALQDEPEAVLLIMPADHVIADAEAFIEAVQRGWELARAGTPVLFGVSPAKPATGYGYIELGQALQKGDVFAVAGFHEKPDQVLAREYVEGGKHLWNSGIFLISAARLLSDMSRFEIALLKASEEALDKAIEDLDFLRLDSESFARAPSISIDYAVMERINDAAVVPVECGWTDVGSWDAIWDIGDRDANGNVVFGEVVIQQATGSYIRSDGPLVAACGVSDLIVVASPDAVLVTRRGGDQSLKQLVEELKRQGKAAATQTRRIYRPWGFYESVHDGDRFQVKRITVSPGAKLSLQKHFHRAEHWVVVNGTALVTRDDEEILLRENESVFLPLGCMHRLENPGRLPLNLIEVQSGPYLGEDDIVRFEDSYGRK